MKGQVKICFESSGEVLNKLKSRGFRATSFTTYDFQRSTLLCPIIYLKKKTYKFNWVDF